jgi:hypothetical protein
VGDQYLVFFRPATFSNFVALRDLGLDDVVLAQGLAGAARDLVARQFDKGVAGGAASRTRTKRVRSLQSFEGQEPRQSDEATAPQFPGFELLNGRARS